MGKKYSDKEVEELLKMQREHCAFSLGLSSSTLIYPRDYDKIKDIIVSSQITNFKQCLKMGHVNNYIFKSDS